MKHQESTLSLRKTVVANPRMKALIDDTLVRDEQNVLKMIDAVAAEVKYALTFMPTIMNLLADHTERGLPLDKKWQVIYQEDEDFVPVVVYNGYHGCMDVKVIMHSDGFARVHMDVSDSWWSNNDFDELDADMIKRVSCAEKLAQLLGAIMLEAGETMMLIRLKADCINSFAVIDQEPRMLSDNEWQALQHERGYSHCTCGMCGGGEGGMRDILRDMMGDGMFGGLNR